jgi:FixJ family two-component response regulator
MGDAGATVYIVDDDESFLRAMSRFLRASGMRVECHNSAADFLERLSPETKGCLVADLQMPGMDGLELQETLAQRDEAIPVVFLTGHGDIATGVSAMRAGAEDFLEKCAPKEALLDAIARALERGARWRGLRERFAALTPREREVLGHVLQGSLNKQIAAKLSIHERTVKLHRTSITHKLGVSSVAELVHLTYEAKLERALRTCSGDERSSR